ncbi:MAG: TrbI/VirB10 family protein [Steroidobacteraceae bacterium]
MTNLKSWWASLTPDRRKMVMGVTSLGVLLGVVYLFITATPKKDTARRADGKVDVNLLTGSDTRTLGIEALGAELRSAEAAQRALQARLDRLEQQAPSKKDVDVIAQNLAALGQGLEAFKKEGPTRADSGDARPLGLRSDSTAVTPGSERPTVPARVPNTGTRQTSMDGLFDSSDVGPDLSSSTPKGGQADSIKVHVFGEVAPQAVNKSSSQSGDVYLPAGSILHGVLLTGVDAPTGMQSKRDPVPALMRIKSEAILPNRFHSDVRECFVILGATGDLSTERALMRAETLSCVRNDGGVIETVLDAYALGDDGKAGIRGRLVSRNGSLVAKATFASFAEALSQVFRPVAIQGFSTSPGSTTQFQSPNTSDALQAAGYAGFGGAMQRVSEYLVKLADEIVPFVEVDAARPVETVLLKGVTLQIRSKSK